MPQPLSFSEALKARLIASPIEDIEVYAEAYPAPKVTTTNIVCVISSGLTEDTTNRSRETYRKRILVTGSATGCMEKAKEIYYFFIPRNAVSPSWAIDTSFLANIYAVYKVFGEQREVLLRNSRNIFVAEIILRFMTAS